MVNSLYFIYFVKVMVVNFPCKICQKAVAKTHQSIQLMQNQFIVITVMFGHTSNVKILTFKLTYIFTVISLWRGIVLIPLIK